MKVLIACEFSGVVRRAFRELGHDAWSCDLLPTEDNDRHHFQSNVMEHLDRDWDLMIAFPPCTYLCNSGARWLYGSGKKEDGHIDGERWGRMIAACEFFNNLTGKGLTSLAFSIPKICVENPAQHRQARLRIPMQDATIHPWEFGHGETKTTHLWLKNLPPLKPTNIVEGREPRVHYVSPGPDRWKERSRTLPGIAEAMAEQWGSL